MSNINPNREVFAELAQSSFDGPVNMLNLLRFRETAAYEDGTEATGAQAYGTYGKEAAPFFAKNGGQIIWRGIPRGPLIGPTDEIWDAGFLAQYPSKDDFIAMVMDPGYQAITFHRTAALLDSRLYCFSPEEVGDQFG